MVVPQATKTTHIEMQMQILYCARMVSFLLLENTYQASAHEREPSSEHHQLEHLAEQRAAIHLDAADRFSEFLILFTAYGR